MTKEKWVMRWMITSGVLAILIGILHDAFTMEMAAKIGGKVPESPELLWRFGYFFAAMGTAVIFSGALMLRTVRPVRRGDRWAWRIALLTSLFLVLLMTGAIYCQMNNLLIQILLWSNLSLAGLLLVRKKGLLAAASPA